MSYYPKTCIFTICSIFSNSGHVGWCTASPDTILKLHTLVMIQTKFGFNWTGSFRGEDFWKSLRRTTSDGNSSPGPKGQVSYKYRYWDIYRYMYCQYKKRLNTFIFKNQRLHLACICSPEEVIVLWYSTWQLETKNKNINFSDLSLRKPPYSREKKHIKILHYHDYKI